MMYKIQTNEKGTRSIEVNETHLEVIKKYALFQFLVDSTGIVDDMVVERLRLNVRAIIESNTDANDLVQFCQEVLYHDNMKSLGLVNLIDLYHDWLTKTDNACLSE